MNIAEKTVALLAGGYTIGQRNPLVNTDYVGDYMVIEAYDPIELPTKDGRNGPWAVVGNDLWLLIEDAWNAYKSMTLEELPYAHN